MTNQYHNQQYATVVHNYRKDDRPMSVGSGYSHSTIMTQSSSSTAATAGSTDSYVEKRSFRDSHAGMSGAIPSRHDRCRTDNAGIVPGKHMVDLIDRTHKQSGKVVTVTNFDQRNNDTEEPRNTHYSGAYFKTEGEKDKRKKEHKHKHH